MKENKDRIKKRELEDEEMLALFAESIQERVSRIAEFTERDANTLRKMILDDLFDISDLELSIAHIEKTIDACRENQERLTYQMDLSKWDIIEQNIISIYLIYNAAVLGVWWTSPNGIEFMKRFLIVAIIGITSFDINLRYFTSDTRKKRASETIVKRGETIEFGNYAIETIRKSREMYIDELRVALAKLIEIGNYNNAKEINIDSKILGWIKELDLETPLKEEVTKLKVRKR